MTRMHPAHVVAVALLGFTLAACLALIAACARAESPHPEPPANPADGVSCYWSTHHNLCLCSGNWHDQNPSLVLTRATSAKACL